VGLFDRFIRRSDRAPAQSPVTTSDPQQLIAAGNAAEDQGRPEEALKLYDQAIAGAPALARAHLNRGNALMALQDFAAAIRAFETALQLDPVLAGAHYNVGNVLSRQRRYEEACDAYRRALSLRPEFADADIALGSALDELGKLDEAVFHYRRALQARPGLEPVYGNLGAVLIKQGQFAEAATCLRRVLKNDPDKIACLSSLVFLEASRADGSTAASLELARSYGASASRKAKVMIAWPNSPEPERTLRIGFVSGDLRAHPVGYFLLSFLTALKTRAAGRLELHAYFNHAFPDNVSARIQAQCHVWRQVHELNDEALVRQIGEDRIDILIDLCGHTGENRLPAFAWKPAPVQATWLGYLGTTGVDAIDYLIADDLTLPPELEPHFTEKIWRLPKSYLCFTPPGEDDTIGPLPALANGYVTFGSFNNLAKVGPDVVSLWARVLHAVPSSRLLLKARHFIERSVQQEMAQRFARHDITASRLMLEPPVIRPDYLKPFNRVDIALDPFPYPGITTSVECLWMGVPFVTLAGKTFMSRQGLGLLSNAGLADWVAADGDDYVKLAARRAADLPSLQQLRQELRPRLRASPIFDAESFARHFESAMRGMWHTWCARQDR
jgi:protein O-GlcNAc transferase